MHSRKGGEQKGRGGEGRAKEGMEGRGGRGSAEPRNNTIVERLWETDFGQEAKHLIRVRRDEGVAAFRRHGVKKHARTSSKPYHRQHRTASNKGGGRREGGGVRSAPWEFIIPTCFF